MTSIFVITSVNVHTLDGSVKSVLLYFVDTYRFVTYIKAWYVSGYILYREVFGNTQPKFYPVQGRVGFGTFPENNVKL